MSPRFLLLAVVFFCVKACSPGVTAESALATAHRYASLEWKGNSEHVLHGRDTAGIPVHTPDVSLRNHGDPGGYWVPGIRATGMPYKWGGFDTPESFLRGIERGRYAGDIATVEKVRVGRPLVSEETVGVDCSGFVSRCWGLPRQYSTTEMPSICERLPSLADLRSGDVLLKQGHVMLFVEWRGDWAICYEAGSQPSWRVHRCRIHRSKIVSDGFKPWRYKGLRSGSRAGGKKSGERAQKEHFSKWSAGPY